MVWKLCASATWPLLAPIGLTEEVDMRPSLRLFSSVRCASALHSHSSSSRVRRVTREEASTSRAKVLLYFLYSVGSLVLLSAARLPLES
jgi:hypothetical protein